MGWMSEFLYILGVLILDYWNVEKLNLNSQKNKKVTTEIRVGGHYIKAPLNTSLCIFSEFIHLLHSQKSLMNWKNIHVSKNKVF